MQHEGSVARFTDLIEKIEDLEGVCFDPETLQLLGLYGDEFAAHRARRGWITVLEENFFLNKGEDFALKVESDLEQGRFLLSCKFTSAAARYAFWRLTHHQAIEAQYLIETAHLPMVGGEENPLCGGRDMRPLVTDSTATEIGSYRGDPLACRSAEIMTKIVVSLRKILCR